MTSQSSRKRFLSLEDLHLKDAEGVRQLFSKLGYTVASDLVPLPKADLALAPTDEAAIERVFLLADQDRQLQVWLFEPRSERDAPPLNSRLRSLAQSFLKRPGNYLLVAADGCPYVHLTIVNPRRQAADGAALRAQIRKLVVDTRHPTRHDLDVLEACAVNGRTPEQIYLAQCDAFNVERITNKFYREYAALFRVLQEKIRSANRGVRELQDQTSLHSFTQHLLERVMFSYFLQRKGWLAGNPQFLTALYRRVVTDDEKLYYNDFLERLFFETLNQRRPNDASPWGNIPYLNGGLFEKDYDFFVSLPNELFDPQSDEGILGFFNSYNFTVEEDTPLEQEVALDPEMLGKVFENLLEEGERGKTGTFYTPRPIVHYMCREALLGYLQNATDPSTALRTGLDRPLLQAQFDDEPERALTVSQANAIESALRDVRVLDPAVGSGAFLVGMLHELVTLRRACRRAKGEEVRRGSAAIAEWKREFIANCLYGVDIKAEAIEIAKLRLWLSLVVDTERAQVEPLPNLDYKLMQGNSLIETLDGQPILAPELPQQRMTFDGQGVLPAMPTTQLTLGMSDTDQTLKVLRDLNDKYFNAEPRDRAKLRQRIHQQETQIVLTHLRQRQADLESRQKALVQKGSQVNWRGMSDAKKQIDGWQAAWQKLEDLKGEIRAGAALPFFLYRLHFGEVFSDRGGFDIVFANPPYVRQELIKSQKTVLEKSFPTVYEGTADLYVYFYARGLDLLRPTGILAFISSNKFMRAEYGTKLRGLLAEQTTIQRVIDFGDLPVFKATTYSCTVITRKMTPSQHHTPTLLRINDIEALEHLEGEIERKAQRVPQNELRSDVWILRGSEIARLMAKILTSGQPLSANTHVKFFNGVKTGLNDAFVIDRQMRAQLIEKHAKSQDLIKPWLQGKNINRWAIHDAGEFILYITWDCPIDHYPAIKSYLSRFRQALEHRDTCNV